MIKELRCPHCLSSQTRFRIKTKNHICFSCGHIWKNKIEKTKEGVIE